MLLLFRNTSKYAPLNPSPYLDTVLPRLFSEVCKFDPSRHYAQVGSFRCEASFNSWRLMMNLKGGERELPTVVEFFLIEEQSTSIGSRRN